MTLPERSLKRSRTGLYFLITLASLLLLSPQDRCSSEEWF